MYEIKEILLEEEKQEQIRFLHQHNLDYEIDIDYAIAIYEHNEMIATASLANNIMKCFLVKKEYQGNQLTNLMFKHLVDVLHSKNIYHFFVFASPHNESIFTSLHMTRVVKTMNTVLLESGETISHVLNELKLDYRISSEKKACVIINANPMTLGHLHLIETAAKQHKEVLVFVVSEDLSSFPFKDRYNIIQQATKQFSNVTVLPTLSYLVSKLTFPKYFLKEDQLISDEQTLVDVLVYKEYYAKIFNITMRYVGEEPFSYNTNKYNQVLKNYLGNRITVVKRKEHQHNAISASYVRKLIKNNHIDKIAPLVPKATYEYLLSEQGKKVIAEIQNKPLGRH